MLVVISGGKKSCIRFQQRLSCVSSVFNVIFSSTGLPETTAALEIQIDKGTHGILSLVTIDRNP